MTKTLAHNRISARLSGPSAANQSPWSRVNPSRSSHVSRSHFSHVNHGAIRPTSLAQPNRATWRQAGLLPLQNPLPLLAAASSLGLRICLAELNRPKHPNQKSPPAIHRIVKAINDAAIVADAVVAVADIKAKTAAIISPAIPATSRKVTARIIKVARSNPVRVIGVLKAAGDAAVAGVVAVEIAMTAVAHNPRVNRVAARFKRSL
jgi:hypothetical protein